MLRLGSQYDAEDASASLVVVRDTDAAASREISARYDRSRSELLESRAHIDNVEALLAAQEDALDQQAVAGCSGSGHASRGYGGTGSSTEPAVGESTATTFVPLAQPLHADARNGDRTQPARTPNLSSGRSDAVLSRLASLSLQADAEPVAAPRPAATATASATTSQHHSRAPPASAAENGRARSPTPAAPVVSGGESGTAGSIGADATSSSAAATIHAEETIAALRESVAHFAAENQRLREEMARGRRRCCC